MPPKKDAILPPFLSVFCLLLRNSIQMTKFIACPNPKCLVDFYMWTHPCDQDPDEDGEGFQQPTQLPVFFPSPLLEAATVLTSVLCVACSCVYSMCSCVWLLVLNILCFWDSSKLLRVHMAVCCSVHHVTTPVCYPFKSPCLWIVSSHWLVHSGC